MLQCLANHQHELYFDNFGIVVSYPGLQHLPSQILSYLDSKCLANSRLVSKSFKEFLDNDRALINKQLNQIFNLKFWPTFTFRPTLFDGQPKWREVLVHLEKMKRLQY